MKTAIYVEDGIAQLVLTPETAFEKEAVGKFRDQPLDVQIFTGTFYDCRGGWVRQNPFQGYTNYQIEDKSLILKIADKEAPQ